MKFGPIVLFCASLGLISPTYGETVNYKADLKPSNEVPPNDSKAAGSVTLTFNDATKTLTWKGTYSDLTGPPTAAHLHGPAPAGKNAGILVPIFVAGSAKAPASPFEGSAMLTDEQGAVSFSPCAPKKGPRVGDKRRPTNSPSRPKGMGRLDGYGHNAP